MVSRTRGFSRTESTDVQKGAVGNQFLASKDQKPEFEMQPDLTCSDAIGPPRKAKEGR